MVLAYKDQIEFLDRLKRIAKAMKGLPPDTNLARALAGALRKGGRCRQWTQMLPIYVWFRGQLLLFVSKPHKNRNKAFAERVVAF